LGTKKLQSIVFPELFANKTPLLFSASSREPGAWLIVRVGRATQPMEDVTVLSVPPSTVPHVIIKSLTCGENVTII
ncbi:hypothetical protein COCVIDRAFT_112290, partial [Bipolaris victoriae FI3]